MTNPRDGGLGWAIIPAAMRVALSGASGLIGSALAAELRGAGHDVARLVRPPAVPGPGDVAFDPEARRMDARALEGVDAVFHFGGENIASGRWTARQKERIRESRVEGTTLIARTLAGLSRKPALLAVASAVGFYGDRGDEVLHEGSAPGTGFLPEVCQAWERAGAPASDAGIRTARLRFGVVLAGHGGALRKMLLPFKLGIGGRIGSGRQWMSWITLKDAVAALRHVLDTASLSGPVNAVSPGTVTNADFTRALGRALRRPAVLPLPAFAARLVLGEMADGLLLASARVVPRRLQATGFEFRHPTIEAALDAVLRPPPRTPASSG